MTGEAANASGCSEITTGGAAEATDCTEIVTGEGANASDSGETQAGGHADDAGGNPGAFAVDAIAKLRSSA